MSKEQLGRQKKIAKYSYGKVLDIGYNQLPNPYLMDPIGLDVSPVKKPENYIEVYGYDGKVFPFSNNTFDSITAGELIEHIDNVGNFLGECKRVLKSKGKLIISTPNPFYLSEIIYNCFPFKEDISPEHINLFPKRALKRHLEYNGFKLTKLISNGTVIPVLGFNLNINLNSLLTQHYIYVCEVKK